MKRNALAVGGPRRRRFFAGRPGYTDHRRRPVLNRLRVRGLARRRRTAAHRARTERNRFSDARGRQRHREQVDILNGIAIRDEHDAFAVRRNARVRFVVERLGQQQRRPPGLGPCDRRDDVEIPLQARICGSPSRLVVTMREDDAAVRCPRRPPLVAGHRRDRSGRTTLRRRDDDVEAVAAARRKRDT
jgi:hypothetical protein